MITQIIKPIPESSDRMEALRYQSAIQLFQCQWVTSTLSSPEALGSDSIPRSTGDTGKWKGNTTRQPRALLPLRRLTKALPPLPCLTPFCLSLHQGAYSFNQPTNKNSRNLLKLGTSSSLQIAQGPPYLHSQSFIEQIWIHYNMSITCPLGTSGH